MDRLRVGVIGAGLWGAQHARVFTTLARAELAAVCDVDAERARAFGERFGAASVHTDHRALLADDTIDAVSIATPDFTHTPLILDALAAGKHVLSEKPLATSPEEAERIAAAAKASPRKLMVDFHNRVNPAVAAARAAVAAGEIGRPAHVMARLSNTTFVPTEMLSWAARSSALWFLGSHAVDALRFILADDVARVYAVSRSGVLKGRGVDTADFHLAILEFAGGTAATLENSWLLSPDNPMLFDFKLEIVGERGQLQLDPSHNGAFRKLDGRGLRYGDMFGVTPAAGDRIGGFVLESIARFVDAVLDDAPVLADAGDGLAVTRTLAAIEESARTGRPVDV